MVTTFGDKTLNIRKPLWLALSDLFLDTELQDYHYAHIAEAMKTSAYSLEEIEAILMLEVFPVCIVNLHSVAGEWAGFDEVWLSETILSARRPNRFRRWMNRRHFWMIKEDWGKVIERYKQL